MKAIIHIGTEKTGTSTLQNVLYMNHQTLMDHGYYFLQSPGRLNNRLLQLMCETDLDPARNDFLRIQGYSSAELAAAALDEARNALRAEFESLPGNIHTVISSSEHFHSRLTKTEEIKRLKEILSEYCSEFEVIVYLRHQADMLESLYSTVVKGNGLAISIEQFSYKRCKPQMHYFAYMDMLNLWREVFGRESLTVRLFRKDMFLNGDLVQDFFMNIAPDAYSILDVDQGYDKNKSLSFMGLALAKAVNGNLYDPKNLQKTYELRRKIIAVIENQLYGKGEKLSLECWQRIDEMYAEQNMLVQQEYFPELDELFVKRCKIDSEPVIDENFQEKLNKVIHMILKINTSISITEINLLKESADLLESEYPELAKGLLQIAAVNSM